MFGKDGGEYIFCLGEMLSLEKICAMKIQYTKSVDWIFNLLAKTGLIRNSDNTFFSGLFRFPFATPEGLQSWQLRIILRKCFSKQITNEGQEVFLSGVYSPQLEGVMLYWLQLDVTGALRFSLKLLLGTFEKGFSKWIMFPFWIAGSHSGELLTEVRTKGVRAAK